MMLMMEGVDIVHMLCVVIRGGPLPGPAAWLCPH